jgi:hypothetical protein
MKTSRIALTVRILVIGLTLSAGLAAVVLAGTFPPSTVTDQTPTAPLANPVPSSFQPRYISGFGSDNSFTVFFEDRDAGYAISYASTTSGPTGFPASATATDIVDTHFVVKEWPINVGGTDYAYRGWGAVGNNPQHKFYVSNDLTNWTLVSTFTISNVSPWTSPRPLSPGYVYYGFHDVILLNGTYYAFAESNRGQTLLVRSSNGDDVWEAFDSVGGTVAAWGPLQLPESGTPSGSFVDLGHDRGYGKVHVRGNDSGFYLAVNTAAVASLPPAALEAAFINPANWTWHDGTTGLPASPILSQTAEHDLRECWVVPQTDPDVPWVIIYDADFGSSDGGKALGWATLLPPPPPYIEVTIDIKPGSFPNSINLNSRGVVPVAVLTTDDFDATTVDPVTVLFADASPLRWTREDVDGDGDTDLLFHFRTQELTLDGDSAEATLTGETTDGTQIEGTVAVNIVPNGG